MTFSNSAYVFDHDAADSATTFIQTYCTHVSGCLSGQPLLLQEWQISVLRQAFGQMTRDGRRRYRYVWIEAPRKSGKSTLAAAILLYMLLVDKEKGAEGYVAASSSSQALVCFNIAKRMIYNNDDMLNVCKLKTRELLYKDNSIQLAYGNSINVSSRNVSFAVLDDLQANFPVHLYEELLLASASREQPIFFFLSAAGRKDNSLACKLHDYASSISKGEVLDSTWLVRIFGADDKDDWSDPNVWARVHPGLNLTISEHFVRERCLRALRYPSYVDDFRRSYLNVWIDNFSQWIDMNLWDTCEFSVDPMALKGRNCKIGIDLSSSTDLTAISVVFPEMDGGFSVLAYAFCPRIPKVSFGCGADVVRNEYYKWSEEGHLNVTEGNIVDYHAVYDKVLELCQKFRVEEIAYDRWGATMLINRLVDEGISCVPVNQDAETLTASVEELERVINNKTLRHDGNPVLRWCASNVVMRSGKNGLLRPSKRRSPERIDLIVALLLALSRF